MHGFDGSAADELLGTHLDRLEKILLQLDAETGRLRTELDLRQLYINELHTILNSQSRQLQDLDARIRRLERLNPSPVRQEPPRRPRPISASIRIKKAF